MTFELARLVVHRSVDVEMTGHLLMIVGIAAASLLLYLVIRANLRWDRAKFKAAALL